MKIIVALFLSSFLFYSCSSTNIFGSYSFVKTHQDYQISISNDSVIKIREVNGGILTNCIGKIKKLSNNKFSISCKDSRGDSLNKGSITNIIPSEFSLSDEVLVIKKNKLIYKNKVLTKK